jgi:DNA-binding response OmpR family regulator
MSNLNAGLLESRDKLAAGFNFERCRMLSGKRCLVVDDELLIALDIEQELTAAGAAEVVCAGGLAEAEEALRKGPFDVAVLDLRLGRQTSLALANELRSAGTPFVFLTGARSDAAEITAFAVPVVEKPFLAPLLLDAVRRALAAG